MAKFDRDDVGSLILNRASTGGGFRPWKSLSAAAFRRKLADALRCGSSLRSSAALERGAAPAAVRAGRSEKLGDLLNASGLLPEPGLGEVEVEADTRRRTEALEELKAAVRMLQSQEAAEQREGAMRVRRLAREDGEARTTLTMLGSIPPLVAMLDSEDPDFVVEPLYALLNLAIRDDVNKAAIVKAGAVHKMLKLIEPLDGLPSSSIAEAVVANFLGLSALDSNKPIIGSSGAIPILVKTLKNSDDESNPQAKQDALRALYNLSICHSNVSMIVETNLIQFLIDSLGDMEVSERVLMILGNLVSTPEGRKGVSLVKDSFPILVDVLNWNDAPECQEKASYVLMVMAHKAYGDRQAMIEAGIVSVLLELTLLGSTLAQKRASRMLECLTVDKGKRVSSENYCGGTMVAGGISAPICGPSSSSLNSGREGVEEDENMMSEERRAVKQLVQQSLQSNMKRIVKRANLPQDFVPSEHFKSLTTSSTSKSLPF